MTIILSIDPGTRTSGVVLYDSDERRVLFSEKEADNDDVLDELTGERYRFDGLKDRWTAVGVERVQATGMAGNDVMITCEWSARFMQAAMSRMDGSVVRWHYRREVLRHLDISGGKGNKDSKVRARLIELHGGTKQAAQGTKKAPGPLYGVSSHSWQALGLALLVADV